MHNKFRTQTKPEDIIFRAIFKSRENVEKRVETAVVLFWKASSQGSSKYEAFKETFRDISRNQRNTCKANN